MCANFETLKLELEAQRFLNVTAEIQLKEVYMKTELER